MVLLPLLSPSVSLFSAFLFYDCLCHNFYFCVKGIACGYGGLKVLILYKLLGTENFWCCLSCVDAGLRHIAHIL